MQSKDLWLLWDFDQSAPWWGDGDYLMSMHATEPEAWEEVVDWVKTNLETWLAGDRGEPPEFDCPCSPVAITVHEDDTVCSDDGEVVVAGAWQRASYLLAPATTETSHD